MTSSDDGRGSAGNGVYPPGPRCPPDTALRQQRMKAYKPLLDPTWTIGLFFFVAAVFVPCGYYIQSLSDSVVELTVPYDDGSGGTTTTTDDGARCNIAAPNENRNCTFTVTVPADMEPPVLVYYRVTNFHQNHRAYRSSVDYRQLQGQAPADQTALARSDCAPLHKLGDTTLNPCGLVANTLFNDVIRLRSAVDARGARLDLPPLREDGIAWRSDAEFRYGPPEGFRTEQCTACDDDCNCDGDAWSCVTPYRDDEGVCHKYFYPDDETTQYLHETYPNVVSPLEGVTNEHFMVWMRIAMRKDFRKLYGWIDTDDVIPKGTELTFEINANWEVQTFAGTKTLIVTTNNVMGGKNDFVGPAFYVTGYCCVVVGVLFSLKQFFNPRKLADRSYLEYKED